MISPDSDGSESGWWTISIWQLVSRVHCPNLVLFYLFLVLVFSAPRNVRDPETPRDSGWPTGSGQPLGGLNVVESVYGITGA